MFSLLRRMVTWKYVSSLLKIWKTNMIKTLLSLYFKNYLDPNKHVLLLMLNKNQRNSENILIYRTRAIKSVATAIVLTFFSGAAPTQAHFIRNS